MPGRNTKLPTRVLRSASLALSGSAADARRLLCSTRAAVSRLGSSSDAGDTPLDDLEGSSSRSSSYSLRKRRRPSASSSDGTISPASSINTHKENFRGGGTRLTRLTREAPLAPVNLLYQPDIEEECELAPPVLLPEGPITKRRRHNSDSTYPLSLSPRGEEKKLTTSSAKVQDAKLKRLNARKIEMDPELALELSSQSLSESQNSSLLNLSIADPKERLLDHCGQSDIKSWSDVFDETVLNEIIKLGEGVYGEVFQTQKGNVVKIFPVEGSLLVNGEKQMTFDEVFPEVFISKKLTELGYKHRSDRTVNFVQLRKSTVVQGPLPKQFSLEWKRFESEKGSDNENLDFLPNDQHWMVLEYDFAGVTLDKFRFTTCREARSVIVQLALSLAAAESAYQFEHRDLHWLNVLVRTTRQSKLRYRVGGISYSVMTQGVQVTIIDFTVSRLCHEGNTVYVDMSDSPEIFEGEGDYQFEIYRMMKDKNYNNWRTFMPITNLYWLHYLMDKLLTETSYPRKDPDSIAVHSELRALYDCVLGGVYKGAMDLVHNNFYFDACRIDSVSSENE